jgi:hypothetical protein
MFGKHTLIQPECQILSYKRASTEACKTLLASLSTHGTNQSLTQNQRGHAKVKIIILLKFN